VVDFFGGGRGVSRGGVWQKNLQILDLQRLASLQATQAIICVDL